MSPARPPVAPPPSATTTPRPPAAPSRLTVPGPNPSLRSTTTTLADGSDKMRRNFAPLPVHPGNRPRSPSHPATCPFLAAQSVSRATWRTRPCRRSSEDTHAYTTVRPASSAGAASVHSRTQCTP